MHTGIRVIHMYIHDRNAAKTIVNQQEEIKQFATKKFNIKTLLTKFGTYFDLSSRPLCELKLSNATRNTKSGISNQSKQERQTKTFRPITNFLKANYIPHFYWQQSVKVRIRYLVAFKKYRLQFFRNNRISHSFVYSSTQLKKEAWEIY